MPQHFEAPAHPVTFGRELESGSLFVAGKLLDIDYEDVSVNGIRFNLDALFLGGTIRLQVRLCALSISLRSSRRRGVIDQSDRV
jgi:hypothetical protein